MPTSVSFKDYVSEILSGLNVKFKKMMGEYLVYCNGTLIGGLYDNRFLVKKTVDTAEYNLSEEIPYSGAKPMYSVDVDDKKTVCEIVLLTCQGLEKNNERR